MDSESIQVEGRSTQLQRLQQVQGGDRSHVLSCHFLPSLQDLQAGGHRGLNAGIWADCFSPHLSLGSPKQPRDREFIGEIVTGYI